MQVRAAPAVRGASRAWHPLAVRLHSHGAMVVPLILLGAATKLAFAVAVTYRTRTWWLPGSYAIVLGALGSLHPGATRTVGSASLALGAAALVIADRLRPRAAIEVSG